MPAKRRVKKQSTKSTKKTTRKNNSRTKTKSSSRKKVVNKTAKKPVKRAAPKKKTTVKKKQAKKSAKKVVKKKTTPVKKRVVASKPKTKVVTKTIVKEVKADDSKFNLLLEELRSIKQNNNELANQIQAIQESKEIQEEELAIQEQKGKGDDSKEELMSELKSLLSKDKKSTSPEVKTSMTLPGKKEVQPRETLFNKPLHEEVIHSKPPQLNDEIKEEFKTTRTRGVLTSQEAEEYSELLKELIKEVNKVFIGQEKVVEGVVLSLICDAHTLLEGVPGLAKSLLIEVLGKTISGTTFERIQFLPDLLPADIIGGQIFNPKTAQFVTHKGPIFANFVLADEINRAPPKTHAAVMEAMQEKKINIENDEFILDRPFLVLATQNPLENKGTYQLPEAVLDRFMFKVILDYPKRSDELKIITDNATTKKNLQKKIRAIMDKEKLLEIQQKVKRVYISDKIRDYILDLVEATRGINKEIQGVKFLKYGAGVRASIYLGLGAKAKALFDGRNYVLPDDVYAVIPDIFRHRLSLNYRGKAHNISTDKIIEEILKKVNAI